jgi:hypothetical protein
MRMTTTAAAAEPGATGGSRRPKAGLLTAVQAHDPTEHVFTLAVCKGRAATGDRLMQWRSLG